MIADKRSVLFVVTVLLMTAVCRGQEPSSPREQLTEYVAQLQKNPSDDALREKIIKLTATLDPKPAVPDDAAVAAAKGKGIFASATSLDDAKAAAAAFTLASTLAPWVPDYYYNEGLALDKAGAFDDAIRAMNFYLTAYPNAPDANDVRGKIEAIKYEKDKAAKQQQQQAAEYAAKQRQVIQSLVGKWKTAAGGPDYNMWSLTADFPSVEIDWTGLHAEDNSFSGDHSYKLQGAYSGENYLGDTVIFGDWERSFDVPRGWPCSGTYKAHGTFDGDISKDGQKISVTESGYQLNIGECRWEESKVQLVFERY